MKKIYENPMLFVETLSAADVIATSSVEKAAFKEVTGPAAGDSDYIVLPSINK